MSSTIDDRVLLLLRNFATAVPGLAGHGVWERLGEQTGIPAQRWRNVMSGRQKATIAMVEALAKRWPQYAFWLTTGITDVANGHRAPVNAVTYPERVQTDDDWSASYFRSAISLFAKLYREAGVDIDNEEERLEASTRTLQMAGYDGGPLVDAAYRLSESEEYAQAIDIWKSREKSREAHVGRLIGTDRPEDGRKPSKKGEGDPLFGGDGQGRHQSPWDMFFKPVSKKGGKKK